MDTRKTDVAIIGAGLSGLSAAYYLAKTDKSIRLTLLEAKDRVGGRTYSIPMKVSGGQEDNFDLGGEWVGRPQPHLHYMLRQFERETFNPQINSTGPNENLPPMSFFTKLDLLLFILKLRYLRNKFQREEELKNLVEAQESDGITFHKYMKANLWTKGAKPFIIAAVKSLFGYMPKEISLLYFLMYINAAGNLGIFLNPAEYNGQEFRVKGGIYQLSKMLKKYIGKKNVVLNCPVTHIIQSSKEKVMIVTEKRLQVNCSRVILAIPPHLSAKIHFSPDLPPTKLTVLKNVPLAFIIKFCITYEEAFWSKNSTDKSRYGFQSIMEEAEHGAIGVVYDGTSAKGYPALVGFVSVNRGTVGEEKNPEDRQVILLNILETYLGQNVRDFLEFQQKDWSTEPYNGGCFLKYLVPGSTRYFNQELREPFDRVHFAGSEAATVWCGFMNGAIQSGFRAAREVLQNLRPNLLTDDIEKEVCRYHSQTPPKCWSKSWIAAGIGIGCFTAIYMMTQSKHIQPTLIFI
ncbi:probable flavin-containing monoamine oxidase A [Octopus vulgaris]|uniref:Amine oxidase n=1 Tax=Octopus vulgaris TaxID=6645 RepID=A0AA36ALR8_OCTVU|nr:probable flavin-containing monoamine oxidase A [Octopus vulgaris]